jgi:hypothetical protein
MRAVRALLLHPAGEAAAKAAGTSLRTLRRYTARPHVRAALAREALIKLRATTTALARHAEGAADALGRMAVGEMTPNSARVRACAAVISAAVRAIELEELAARVEELEKSAVTRREGGLQ